MERLIRFWPHARHTLRYWSETETHVYSFSVAANVLLAFFPFLIVITSLIRFALHWFDVERGIYLALKDYFPGTTGDFLVRNLQMAVYTKGRALPWFSMLLLLFTANGIFMPLEVALNRIWGIAKNRSFLKNQLISQGLIFGCGALWIFTSMAASPVVKIDWLGIVVYKIVSLPITVAIVFLTYWLLPNAKIPPLLVLVSAIFVSIGIESAKLINRLIWPWVHTKIDHEYGPFEHSIVLILWSFVFSMFFLAGAEWSARQARELGLQIQPRDT